MSSAVTMTSTSPETPVSSWSTSTLRSSGRSRGTSSRMSEMISVRVPAIHPATASTVAAASTRPGRAIETASERGPSSPRRPRTRAFARESTAGGRGRRPRSPAPGPAPSRSAGHREDREPGGQREGEGDDDPGDQQDPEGAHHRDRREQQDQEAGARSRGTRSRSPGRRARRPRRRPARATSRRARASWKRACSWIA